MIVKLVSSYVEYPIATYNASNSASGVWPKIVSSPPVGGRRNVVPTYYLIPQSSLTSIPTGQSLGVAAKEIAQQNSLIDQGCSQDSQFTPASS